MRLARILALMTALFCKSFENTAQNDFCFVRFLILILADEPKEPLLLCVRYFGSLPFGGFTPPLFCTEMSTPWVLSFCLPLRDCLLYAKAFLFV